MRILVASDRMGELSSSRAGRVIGTGWSGESVRVVPVGEAGNGFVEAYGDAVGAGLQRFAQAGGLLSLAEGAAGAAVSWESATSTDGGLPYAATSMGWGRAVRSAAERRPGTLYVDLVGPRAHDAGAGALMALGTRADVPLDQGVDPLARISQLDLDPARRLLGDVQLVGVVPEAELSTHLLGLRGITSRLGREHGEDPARMLAVDAALERLASLASPAAARAPGSGACGGLGFAILTLGGRLVTGPSVTLDTVSAAARRVDLVVSGCDVFDFARRGGGVVAEAARLATTVLAPCIVLAGEVFVGAREMRAMGIEAAYGVRADGNADADPAGSPTEEDLAALARRVARTWRW